jgi:hypothetical protein
MTPKYWGDYSPQSPQQHLRIVNSAPNAPLYQAEIRSPHAQVASFSILIIFLHNLCGKAWNFCAVESARRAWQIISGQVGRIFVCDRLRLNVKERDTEKVPAIPWLQYFVVISLQSFFSRFNLNLDSFPDKQQ